MASRKEGAVPNWRLIVAERIETKDDSYNAAGKEAGVSPSVVWGYVMRSLLGRLRATLGNATNLAGAPDDARVTVAVISIPWSSSVYSVCAVVNLGAGCLRGCGSVGAGDSGPCLFEVLPPFR
jgi:hypothetical protein